MDEVIVTGYTSQKERDPGQFNRETKGSYCDSSRPGGANVTRKSCRIICYKFRAARWW